MADIKKLTDTLKARGFSVSSYATGQEAADYLDSQIDGCTVASGGSMTLRDLGILPRLAAHNKIMTHRPGEASVQEMTSEVYLCSVNGLAETGEIINIDGTGNRVASTLFGHKRVYLVVGSNKIAPDYESALRRARNIAAPKNAQRLHCSTPCAVKGDRCYNCKGPNSICSALVVLWNRPRGIDRMEIVLVDEDLGY